MLMTLFLILAFLFFGLESNEYVSNESDGEGFGYGFTSGSCPFSCIELSVDRVGGLLCKVVIKSVCRVS